MCGGRLVQARESNEELKSGGGRQESGQGMFVLPK